MSPVQIVGILNVTPDSYFDGGQFDQIDDAVRRAAELLQQGADIIEIGGESTGPGSKDVSVEEEIERVIPSLKAILEEHPDAQISVDTYKAEVAKQALEAGATMINDVTAGRGDAELFSVVAEAGAKLVLMYAKDDSARTTVSEKGYEDVVETIIEFLEDRAQEAMSAGVSAENIIIDPGMGHFVSSDSQYSFALLRHMEKLATLGYPLFVSTSRKSFLAGTENLPPSDRLPGTIASSAIAVYNGVQYIRTHDVLQVRRACEIAQSIKDA